MAEDVGRVVAIGHERVAELPEEHERLVEQAAAEEIERRVVLELRIPGNDITEPPHPIDRALPPDVGAVTLGVEGLVGAGKRRVVAVEVFIERGEGRAGPRLHDRHGTEPDEPYEERRGECCRHRPVPPCPATDPVAEGLRPSRHRLVREPGLDVRCQAECGGIAVFGAQRQRLETDRLEAGRHPWLDPPRRHDLPPPNPLEDLVDPRAGHRRPAREHLIEDRPEAVDVARRAEPIDRPFGLFGGHVERRADGGTTFAGKGTAVGLRDPHRPFGRGRVGRGGRQQHRQPPVDHHRLAVRTEHDIRRLEVAVEHAPAVGVADGIADVDEPPQELTQLEGAPGVVRVVATAVMEAVDGIGERFPADQPHRVEGTADGVAAEAVDGDDPRVLELPGELGLEHELRPARLAVGVGRLDLLEGHLTVELVVDRHGHDAEPPLGIRTHDQEATVVRRRRAERLDPPRHPRLAPSPIRRSPPRAKRPGHRSVHVGDAGLHIGVGEPADVLDNGCDRADRLQAPRRIAAVGVHMFLDERLEDPAAGGGQIAPLHEHLAERLILPQQPGVHRAEEPVARHEIHLVGQDSQQEISIGVTGHRIPRWSVPLRGYVGHRHLHKGPASAGKPDGSRGWVLSTVIDPARVSGDATPA